MRECTYSVSIVCSEDEYSEVVKDALIEKISMGEIEVKCVGD